MNEDSLQLLTRIIEEKLNESLKCTMNLTELEAAKHDEREKVLMAVLDEIRWLQLRNGD